MAITVTSLGTNQAKAATSVQLTYAGGLVAAAGDWLVICYAGDLAGLSCVFYDASTDITYQIINQAAVLNSGQASAEVWLFHLPVATAANDYVQVNSASNSANTIAVYKVTGIDYSTVYTDYTGTTTSYQLYSTAIIRAGQYIPNAKACTISSIGAYLAAYGTVSGTAYCRIRKASDDSIIGTLGTIDVSTLSTSPELKTFNSTPVSITADEPIYILIEYSGGNSSNYIKVYATNTISAAQFGCYYGVNYVVSFSISSFSSISGGLLYNPFDKSATATGSGTAPSSGACDTLSQAEELGIGVIGVEDVPGDVSDTFTAGASNVSGNEQSTGTTGSGDASNITIVTAAEVLSATTAQTAAQTGNNSTDWAALMATFRAAAGVISQIATVPRASIGQMATVASAAMSQVAGVAAN